MGFISSINAKAFRTSCTRSQVVFDTPEIGYIGVDQGKGCHPYHGNKHHGDDDFQGG